MELIDKDGRDKDQFGLMEDESCMWEGVCCGKDCIGCINSYLVGCFFRI